MKAGRWISGIILLIVFILLGGFRDILFVNINEQIAYNNGFIEDYRVLQQFHFLNDYDSAGLTKAKWGLTLLFSLVYLLLSILALRTVLLDRKAVKWLLLFYLGAFLCAGFTYLLGKVSGNLALGYTLSRVLMGALQSPFPLMLMIPARMLGNR